MKNTACFTGSRPQNLPFKSEDDKRCQGLLLRIEEQIIFAIENGYRNFISGMAIGVDTYAARIVLKLKRELKDVELKLIAAIPHPEQSLRWNDYQKYEYERILKKCDKRIILSTTYSKDCYQKRNEYMVDNSSLVIAVSDGRPSGTQNTINYARSQNKKVIVLHP